MKAAKAATSRIYHDDFHHCVSEGAPPVEGVWISAGEPKCGEHSPYRRLELVPTEKLRSDYTDYVHKDLRLWITDPSGKSALLSRPDELKLPFPQSIYSCRKEGPRGFTCPAKHDRRRCCRRGIEDGILFEATYAHPFQSGATIRVRNQRSIEAVAIIDARGRKPHCNAKTGAASARRNNPVCV